MLKEYILSDGEGIGGKVYLAQICETPGLPGRWRRSLWWALNEFGGKL